jgi:hypothetical protein
VNLACPLWVSGVVNHQFWNLSIHGPLLSPALRYVIWADFQQYQLQGVFHQRLQYLTANPWLSSTLCALIFISSHFPNSTLMDFMLLGGFVLSWITLNNLTFLLSGTVRDRSDCYFQIASRQHSCPTWVWDRVILGRICLEGRNTYSRGDKNGDQMQ